jgi:hypothetical protein
MSNYFGPLGYRLEQKAVSPDDLILHPRNPRLTASESDYFCDRDEDYSQAWIQNNIKEELQSKTTHGLSGLIKSIKVNGFLDINSIVVKNYNGSYLVLEGNRRTVAIKSITQEGSAEKHVMDSIRQIPVKVLYLKNGVDEDEIVNRIIGSIQGQVQPFGPMESAFFTYSTYINQLRGQTTSDSDIGNNQNAVNATAHFLSSDNKEIRAQLRICVLFKKLRSQYEEGISSDKYSMLKSIVEKPTLARDYFEYTHTDGTITKLGMDRLYKICLCKDRPISDPKKVRLLHEANKHNRIDVLDGLYEHSLSFNEAKITIDETATDNKFTNGLTKIAGDLDKLNFNDYEATSEQDRLIDDILLNVENLKSVYIR